MSSDNPHNSQQPNTQAASSGGPVQQGAQTLISRRALLYGALGAGAVAAVGVGAFALNASRRPTEATAEISGGAGEVVALSAPESALTTLNDFEALESYEQRVKQTGSFDLEYGTLVWVDDDTFAACLLPTEKGSPLSKIGLLNMTNGNLTTVFTQAVGYKDRFEIYDVRATSSGIIWTEANVLDGIWRVYASKITGVDPEEPRLLEEGNSDYETPMLAVADERAFWQVVPRTPNDKGLTSRLMGVTFGSDDGACVFESVRRMGTPPYSADGSIVIAPRIDRPAIYYQLTNIDAKTGAVLDRLTMPQSMVPLEAGYGANGFMFSIPDIYDNASAIANLGTYTPRSKPDGSNYSGAQWFGFARTPTAAPAWCDNLLIVKSSYSVCGVDLNAGHYFAIDVENGADNYGDYLASSGTHPTFVTYSNIDHTPVNGKAIHTCRVRVWTPHELTSAPQNSGNENTDNLIIEEAPPEDDENENADASAEAAEGLESAESVGA